MTYIQFKTLIHTTLREQASGLTWPELKSNLGLPYKRPCPEWTRRLEREIGLTRRKGAGNALIWSLDIPVRRRTFE